MLGVSALAAGAALGVRHALEADHLAAIGTLIDGDAGRPGLVGVSWGIGHAVPIAGLGLGFLGLGIRFPPVVVAVVEALAGLVLVALGARLLRGRPRAGLVTGHDHGGGRHPHLSLGRLSFGVTHLHVDRNSLLVGAVQGIAGSGALVILLVTSSPSTGAALGFLGAFTGLSILTMGAVAWLYGRAMETIAPRLLETGAAVVGITVGLAILLRQALAFGLL